MADYSQLGKFFNSPAGQAAINAAGSGLTAWGASKQAGSQMAQSKAALDAQRAQAALAARPLGASQQYAQRQALMAALLPGLRNSNITPGDPAVAAAMGQQTGGFRLPEGGLPPELLKLYSPQATASAIGQHDVDVMNLDPNAAATDYASLGLAGNTAEQMAYKQRALRRAIQGDIQAESGQPKDDGGSDWWKYALMGASFAVPVVGPALGMSALAANAAGAGLGAATSLANRR